MRKQLIRFYFSADKLDGALNNVIYTRALKSYEATGSGEWSAKSITDIIDVKDEFQSLWAYINSEISDFDKSDMEALEFYAFARSGLGKLSAERKRKIKSALVKFMRRIKFVSRYERAVRLVKEFYCLM